VEKLHEILYRADIGVKTVDRLIDGVRRTLGGHDADWESVKGQIAKEAKGIFEEAKKGPLNVPNQGPWVILVIGVNGVGKTTTIGKLAAKFKGQGKTVMLCAADTFRAAAIEQLQVWGERNDVPVIKQHPGADPAAVAFDGVQAAKARNIDVLIIDTAGRLHSKIELMAELAKINKSIGKDLVGAPHETWIVLDATTGQNAFQQCKAFSEVTALSGIIMTKLDGTAKGGVIIGIADQFKLPIRFIGLGEKVDDLRDFNGDEFVNGLF
ncbi:MAG: signal recognition particle-docking protein FtsY, partial [Proteobacteria bacterium]|nr:signal recognition particle-docking protein FtsY [Pseudomonadota bacterium]